MPETWVRIQEGPYEISNFGRFRIASDFTGGNRLHNLWARINKVIPSRPNRIGYLTVNASQNGKRRTLKIHVLVARAFLGPRPDDTTINHINGDKSDNRVENLEYVSLHYNLTHARKLGKLRTKLSIELAREIRAFQFFFSVRQLAEIYKQNRVTIYDILMERTWKESSWSFEGVA